jgi:hypothetical protein
MSIPSKAGAPASSQADLELLHTIEFAGVTAVVWLGFEGRRFQGPPVGDTIAKRQTAIAAAEAGLRAQE